MRYLSRLSSFGFISALFISVLSCQQLSPIEPTARPRLLPTTIVYHAEGTLAHLVYQSRFTYSADNELLSIRDSVLSASIVQRPIKPWVQFQYANHRLSQIELPAIFVEDDSVNRYGVSARYAIRYEDRYLLGQLIVDGRPIREARFELDAAGFPVKRQVRVGRLFLDGQGHHDVQAAVKAGVTKDYDIGLSGQLIDEQYDGHANIFADSPAYQILDALLTGTNADKSVSTGLGGLDNALLTNNRINRIVRWCALKENCYNYTRQYETPEVNQWGFPTKRNAIFGVMGMHYYTITYTTVN